MLHSTLAIAKLRQQSFYLFKTCSHADRILNPSHYYTSLYPGQNSLTHLMHLLFRAGYRGALLSNDGTSLLENGYLVTEKFALRVISHFLGARTVIGVSKNSG